MAAITFQEEVTNAGVSLTLDPQTWGGGNAIVYLYTTAPVTLASNININVSTNFNQGSSLIVFQTSNEITRNGRSLNIVLPVGGTAYNADWQFLTPSMYVASNVDGTNYAESVAWDLVTMGGSGGGVDAAGALLDNSVSPDKLTDLTSAQIIVGNASNRPTATAVTGDVTITNAGVTAIAAGVIVNADVNASAAISLSKLAALTVYKVVVTDGSGVITTANQLSALLGGNGIDNSAATGFPIWTAGTQAVGALTDVRHLDNISFVTANQGTYYVYFPFACTVTNINIRVTSVVSGTDDGLLTIANNSGTVMTGSSLTAGVLTVAASAAFGTGYASTLLTNNTFTSGQSMRITSSKPTSGGIVSADITYTRTS